MKDDAIPAEKKKRTDAAAAAVKAADAAKTALATAKKAQAEFAKLVTASGQLVSGGAQGLLGMAFHPDYQSNGYFYLNMSVASQTGNNFDQVIKRYSVSADKNIADASSGQEIFRWGVPNFFHSGGWIDFGPNDDYLYIATGDGFEGEAAAQFPTSPLGKILRIDVNQSRTFQRHNCSLSGRVVAECVTRGRTVIRNWRYRKGGRADYDKHQFHH